MKNSGRIQTLWLSAAFACLSIPGASRAQQPPDAQYTKNQLDQLMRHYPPELKNVLALDPSLVNNQSYLNPYPALTNFLGTHPEIVRNPTFYFEVPRPRQVNDGPDLSGLAGLFVFVTTVGLVVWLTRTVIDYRRWNRLAKVQTDAHTKILDRFTDNADLLAYVQSAAGKRFLESSPITLDATPRAVAAPLGRILWSVQLGIILTVAGLGLYVAAARMYPVSRPAVGLLGGLAIAVGIGFVISAFASYLISRKLGLIESPAAMSHELPRGE